MMAKVKDWLIEMENMVYEALERGFSSEDEVFAYVNTYMIADKGYVHEVLEKFHAGWE